MGASERSLVRRVLQLHEGEDRLAILIVDELRLLDFTGGGTVATRDFGEPAKVVVVLSQLHEHVPKVITGDGIETIMLRLNVMDLVGKQRLLLDSPMPFHLP